MWKLILGNPTSAVGIGAIVVCLLIASFGYGYYVATGQYQAALLSQQQAIVVAQHDLDAANHAKAVAASALVVERRKKSDTAAAGVAERIEKLPEIATQDCQLNPDVLQLLNEAGR